jgi:hypothetical protein
MDRSLPPRVRWVCRIARHGSASRRWRCRSSCGCSVSGGVGGGRSTLSPAAREFMRKYEALRAGLDELVCGRFDAGFRKRARGAGGRAARVRPKPEPGSVDRRPPASPTLLRDVCPGRWTLSGNWINWAAFSCVSARRSCWSYTFAKCACWRVEKTDPQVRCVPHGAMDCTASMFRCRSGPAPRTP